MSCVSSETFCLSPSKLNRRFVTKYTKRFCFRSLAGQAQELIEGECLLMACNSIKYAWQHWFLLQPITGTLLKKKREICQSLSPKVRVESEGLLVVGHQMQLPCGGVKCSLCFFGHDTNCHDCFLCYGWHRQGQCFCKIPPWRVLTNLTMKRLNSDVSIFSFRFVVSNC